jgi:hypothetical protein
MQAEKKVGGQDSAESLTPGGVGRGCVKVRGVGGGEGSGIKGEQRFRKIGWRGLVFGKELTSDLEGPVFCGVLGCGI